MLDEKGANQFIAQAKWTFAKTMPQWPHEYTVRDQNVASEFEEFLSGISGTPEYIVKKFTGRGFILMLDTGIIGQWGQR